MQYIEGYWWVWLIGMVVTFLYGGWNQTSRMNRMMALQLETNFFQGVYALFAAALLYVGFMVLLITSIVLNVIHYVKEIQ